MEENKVNNIKLEVSSEVSTGIYSNLVVISHAPTEMVLDFAQMLPGQQGAIVRQRTIMSPVHAKNLLMALADNIEKYERQFGKIEVPQPANQQRTDTVPFDIIGKA